MGTVFIKILCTIGFFVLFFLLSKIGTSSFSPGKLKRVFHPGSYLADYFFSSITFVIAFSMFSVLSVSFHYKVLLLTLAVILGTGMISYLLLNLTGLSVKERYAKVQKLAFSRTIFSTISNKLSTYLFLASIFTTLASWLTAVVIFWINPLGDSTTTAWIAVLIYAPFIISHLLIYALVTYLSSENIDDDLRNFQLVRSFASIFLNIFIFIVPYVIIRYMLQNTDFPLPSFWWFIMVPLAILLIFVLIPYFIGIKKYAGQVTDNKEWLIAWMEDALNVLNFPDKNSQQLEIAEKIENLDNKIGEKREDEYTQQYLVLIDNPEGVLPNAAKSTLDFFNDNNEKLKKWDTNLSYLDKLKEVHDNFIYPDKTLLKDYLKYNIELYQEETVKKNAFTGYVITIISGITAFVYKFFETDINSYVRQLFS